MKDKYPELSTYQFASNCPISGIDLDGLEFIHFSEQDVKNRAAVLKNNPEKINQGNTGTCGIASCIYMLGRKDPSLLCKGIMDLYSTGQTKINDYELDASFYLEACSPTGNIFQSAYAGYSNNNQYSADWILMSTLRDEENLTAYFGYESNSLACMTFPTEMKSLMKDFVGLQDIQSHNIGTFGLGSGVSWDPSLTLSHMESRFKEGRKEAMFINGSMADNPTGKIKGSPYGDHWVTYNGGLKVNYDTNNAIQSYTFNIVTWGASQSVTVTPEEFRDTYHGSISGK